MMYVRLGHAPCCAELHRIVYLEGVGRVWPSAFTLSYSQSHSHAASSRQSPFQKRFAGSLAYSALNAPMRRTMPAAMRATIEATSGSFAGKSLCRRDRIGFFRRKVFLVTNFSPENRISRKFFRGKSNWSKPVPKFSRLVGKTFAGNIFGREIRRAAKGWGRILADAFRRVATTRECRAARSFPKHD